MLLNKDNLAAWKAEVNKLMKKYVKGDDYTNCLSDEDWLEEWDGFTPEEFVSEELWSMGT